MTLVRLFLLVALGVALLSMGWTLVDRSQPAPLPSLEVEVLNGCGVDGIAARVATELEALGQVVARVENAPRKDYERTLLVDRRARPLLTARLAERIGGIPLLLERVDGSDVDVTLVLGQDAEELGILTSRPSMLR